MILNINEEKEKINSYIVAGVQEILYKGLRIDGNNLGNLEDDINLFLRAMQVKNKIYDYACMLKYDGFLKRYEGIIIYNLINSDDLKYEEEIKFYF